MKSKLGAITVQVGITLRKMTKSAYKCAPYFALVEVLGNAIFFIIYMSYNRTSVEVSLVKSYSWR